MKTTKYFIIGVILVTTFYFCLWSFNHINPWVGILAIAVFLTTLVSVIYKQINKHLK